jgi:hypothetical protein
MYEGSPGGAAVVAACCAPAAPLASVAASETNSQNEFRAGFDAVLADFFTRNPGCCRLARQVASLRQLADAFRA